MGIDADLTGDQPRYQVGGLVGSRSNDDFHAGELNTNGLGKGSQKRLASVSRQIGQCLCHDRIRDRSPKLDLANSLGEHEFDFAAADLLIQAHGAEESGSLSLVQSDGGGKSGADKKRPDPLDLLAG